MCRSLTDSLRYRYFEIMLQVDIKKECPNQKHKNCHRSVVSEGPNVICGSNNLPNVDQNLTTCFDTLSVKVRDERQVY